MADSMHLDDMSEMKQRLDSIVDMVSDYSLPFDEVFSLYEEAVDLGMKVSEMVEEEMLAKDRVPGND